MAAIRCYAVDMMKLVTKSPTYREGENQEKRLAWDLGSGDVGADSDKGRVDKSSVCGSDGVGSGDGVWGGVSVSWGSGVDKGVSFGLTLSKSPGGVWSGISGVWKSNTLGDGIKTLGDWVQTSA